MSKHTHWRDCKEWRDFGLPFSCTSDEACRMFDAAITQLLGWYSDPAVGGVEGAIKAIFAADPAMVMGHVLKLGIELFIIGRIPRCDADFRQRLDTLCMLADRPETTDLEKAHAQAVQLLANGQTLAATQEWERALITYPCDILALKFAYDMDYYQGHAPERRDMVARVLPHWQPHMPLYGNILGLYSFGLCETGSFLKGEHWAKKCLEENPSDAWGTHAMAHVLDMCGRSQEGLDFMASTVNNWAPCDGLACHNYWHWAAYAIEQGKYHQALDLFDSQVAPTALSSRSHFAYTDASSLLYRLEMEGQSVEGRWSDLKEITMAGLVKDHHGFTDSHYILGSLRCGAADQARRLVQQIRQFTESGNSDNQRVKREVGIPLYESLVAYDDCDYVTAVDKLLPVRYKLHLLGGSDAQRDLYNQFMIHAAMKSPDRKHAGLAKSLLYERQQLRENSPLTDRLMEKVLLLHGSDR